MKQQHSIRLGNLSTELPVKKENPYKHWAYKG